MSDDKPRADDQSEGMPRPTVNQPLNAQPRPRLRPLLWLVAFVVALVLLYFIGVEVLVPAD